MSDLASSSHSIPLADGEPPRTLRDWEKQVARLRTLQEVGDKLNSSLDIECALINVLDEAIRTIGAERGCLLFMDPTTGELEPKLYRHLHLSDFNSKFFHPSRTVIKRVWCEGKPILTANALQDPDLAKATSIINYALRSILCVPLRVQEERVGVLYLDNRLKSGQFDEDDLALAVAIADQAAIALRNAQLHQQVVNRSRKQMEILQRIQSLNQINLKVQGLDNFHDALVAIGEELEQFGYGCTIALLSGDRIRLEIHYTSSERTIGPDPSSNVGQVPFVLLDDTTICRQVLELRSGRFISRLNDVMAELFGDAMDSANQPAFVAPLMADNQAIGLLILRLDNSDAEEPSLLTAFANQVAATIEISRLRTELQERLTELQSILAITRAMVSEISLDNLLDFITVQAENLTNAEGAIVLLLSDDGRWLEVVNPSYASSRMRAGDRLLARDSLPGLALESQKVQVNNQVTGNGPTAAIRALLQPIVLRSLMCAPLTARSENLGALMIWNKRDRLFTQHDKRLIGLFADEAALALQNARLHARNRQLAIEQERHRLARDLHDSVTQSLYSIGLAAQTSLRLLNQANVDDRIRDPIEHIQAISRVALADMRQQLSDLHPTALTDDGLVEALVSQCALLREHHGLDIQLVADQEPSISACQKEALYYIAREALWNVVKHAGARHVDVLLTDENCHVTLVIQDDGAGFDLSIFDREETVGLRNMGERAELAGGSFELKTGLGRGTRITVRIPA